MKAAKAVTKTLQTQGLRMVTVDIKGGLNITMIFKRVGERDFRYRKPKPKINTLLSTQSIGFRVGCPFVGQ